MMTLAWLLLLAWCLWDGSDKYLLPLAIIIAGLFIAGSIGRRR